MKKRINVHLFKNGSSSDRILRMIGNYNEGEGDISVRDLEGYFAVEKCTYPITSCAELFPCNEPNSYAISEDGGKTFLMTLEFAEIYELANVDDIKDVL